VRLTVPSILHLRVHAASGAEQAWRSLGIRQMCGRIKPKWIGNNLYSKDQPQIVEGIEA
jgi:hypothetical protein